jgi:hypothetical protein
MAEAHIAGTGMTPNELAAKTGLSIGGMVFVDEVDAPSESYATRLRKHNEAQAKEAKKREKMCPVIKADGSLCQGWKIRYSDFCVSHTKD